MKKAPTGPFYAYMMECSDGTFYTGISNNLERRLRQHNGEIKGGAFYTQNKRPVKLIYKEEFETHKEAMQREFSIKKLTRKQKKLLVSLSKNKN
jgi:putative endonuclease